MSFFHATITTHNLEGKTNHGQTLYGRATRHKDVSLCCIGALSFYLMYRFAVTREFESFTLEDWLENSKWFDIKLLIDIQGTQNTKEMKNRSFSEAIKLVLLFLGIAALKLVHLGRNLGAKLLEMLEVESRAIQTMGNWNPSMQDACYSTKLPMVPIRKLAGFTDASGMYYNTRTMIKPGMDVLEQTPIGHWVYKAQAAVAETIAADSGKWTAFNFLSFMVELNTIFIQDGAAMLILHPERIEHPVFQLAVFRSAEFHVSFFVLFSFCHTNYESVTNTVFLEI
jgi:hypothetical protein